MQCGMELPLERESVEAGDTLCPHFEVEACLALTGAPLDPSHISEQKR